MGKASTRKTLVIGFQLLAALLVAWTLFLFLYRYYMAVVPSLKKSSKTIVAAPAPGTYGHGNNFMLPKRLTVRHVEGWGQGVGFGTDYSTVAGFWASNYRPGYLMPLVDARIHRFDNNTYASNLGAGGRYIPAPNTFCELLGFNAFWDFRQGNEGSYHQIGAGIEVLGKRWDFRANGYFPVGVKGRCRKCVFDDFVGGFFAINRRCEFTSYGFNGEVGWLAINGKNILVYTAVGPYYLARRCHDRTLGGKARIRPQFRDYLALDLSVQHDSFYKTVYQAEIIFYLPLYRISSRTNKHGPCGITDRQIYQPIERFEIMPLSRSNCWKRNF